VYIQSGRIHCGSLNSPLATTSISTALCVSPPPPKATCVTPLCITARQRPNLPLFQCKRNLESHLLLDLRNRQTWVQALRTSPRAVQNSMTPVQTHAIIQRRLSLLLLLVSAVRQPSITLQQHCRAKVFLRVPPVRRAGGGAAGAENALVEAIELFAVFFGLQVFLSVWRRG